MSPKAVTVLIWDPSSFREASAGVKFDVFCRALKPALGLSGNGLQQAFGLLGPHNGQWGRALTPPPPPARSAPWVCPCSEA